MPDKLVQITDAHCTIFSTWPIIVLLYYNIYYYSQLRMPSISVIL
jgi:hypothetical protein